MQATSARAGRPKRGRDPLRALVLACLVTLVAGPWSAFAQNNPRSTLADVTFPQPAQVWLRDAEGSQVATLELAASLAGRSCGSSEYHIWRALAVSPNDLRIEVDAAFEAAGWTLGLISLVSDDGERIYLAERAGAELVMSWLPTQDGMGLLLCNVVGTQAAEALPEVDLPEPEAAPADFIPIPIRRPEPGVPVAAVAPAEETPGEVVDAGAEAPVDDEAAVLDEDARVPAADEAPVVDGLGPADLPQAEVPDQAEEEPPVVEAAPVASEPAADEGNSFFSVLVLLFVAGAAGAGAFFLGRRGIAELRRKRIVPTWPGVVATVLYSQVASQTRTDAKGLARTVFVPVIEYEYDVGGEFYQAARLSFDDAAETSAGAAERIVAQYPVGAGIEVRYDPKDPFNATIDTGADRLNLPLIGAVGLGVLALAALIAAIG